jgi:hypothetical protein
MSITAKNEKPYGIRFLNTITQIQTSSHMKDRDQESSFWRLEVVITLFGIAFCWLL